MKYISGSELDERQIRCDLDPGYDEGRQFGRGRSGGQVRDEYRTAYDAGRGGYGPRGAPYEETEIPVGAGSSDMVNQYVYNKRSYDSGNHYGNGGGGFKGKRRYN
jgi:hypothetical protein